MKALVYLLGTLIVGGGILYGMMALGLPQPALIAVGLVILGIGLTGMAREMGSSRKVSKTVADTNGNATTTETEVSTSA